jgi:hypothetical protein
VTISYNSIIFAATLTVSRNKSIWGDDADVWRPSRWFDGTVKSPGGNIGVWANLCGKSLLHVCHESGSDSLLGCLLAPDIAPVSDGDLRGYSILWNSVDTPELILTVLRKYKRSCTSFFQTCSSKPRKELPEFAEKIVWSCSRWSKERCRRVISSH